MHEVKNSDVFNSLLYRQDKAETQYRMIRTVRDRQGSWSLVLAETHIIRLISYVTLSEHILYKM